MVIQTKPFGVPLSEMIADATPDLTRPVVEGLTGLIRLGYLRCPV